MLREEDGLTAQLVFTQAEPSQRVQAAELCGNSSCGGRGRTPKDQSYQRVDIKGDIPNAITTRQMSQKEGG